MNGSMDLLNEGSFLVSTEESIALLRRVPAPVWTKERFFLQYNFVQQCKNMQLYCKVGFFRTVWLPVSQYSTDWPLLKNLGKLLCGNLSLEMMRSPWKFFFWIFFFGVCLYLCVILFNLDISIFVINWSFGIFFGNKLVINTKNLCFNISINIEDPTQEKKCVQGTKNHFLY